MSYQPGTYKKGNRTREATNPSEAVQAVFEGFSRVEDEPKEAVGSSTGPHLHFENVDETTQADTYADSDYRF